MNDLNDLSNRVTPSDLPSGKRLHSYRKSPLFIDKSTMSMVIFDSYVTNYQREPTVCKSSVFTVPQLELHQLQPCGHVDLNDFKEGIPSGKHTNSY